MPDVIITNECHQLIRSRSVGGFRNTGQQMVDGTWMIPLERSTLEAVMSYRLDGETISDTIIRVLSGKPN